MAACTVPRADRAAVELLGVPHRRPRLPAEQALNITLATGKHLSVPDDPDAIIVRSRAPNKQVLGNAEYFRNLVGPTYTLEGDKKNVLVVKISVEVRVRYFQDVELTVEYVTDVSDPRGRASLALSEKDW
jgi:hypothetical protein